MNRIWASGLIVGLLGASLIASSEPAQAADLGTVSINCDGAEITSQGAVISATGGVGDTFVIDNTGLSDDCVITATAILAGEDADHDGAGAGVITPGGGASGSITIETSGVFTVSSSGTGTPSVTIVVDACSLSGAGVEASPWLVADGAGFKRVGVLEASDDDGNGYLDSCPLSGHYLQTANITGVDTDADGEWIVTGDFTGVYDGGHYSISYFSGGGSATYESRSPVFATLGSGGIIRKLNLTGHIKGSSTNNASLVENLEGGLISEVKSSVWLEVEDSNAEIGGLVSVAGHAVDNPSQRIQYSAYTGRIDWTDDGITNVEGPTIGGLVGQSIGTGTTEIRDSYSRAAISFDSGDLTGSDAETAVYAGGLVGSDGGNDLTLGQARVHTVGAVHLIRSYFAGSFTNTCSGTASECNTDSPSHVFTGGLIGVSTDLNMDDVLVSSFWLSSSATNPIGEEVGAGDQPVDYTETSPAFPVAPGLSSTLLRTLTTYQSEEGDTAGLPSGDADLAVASSTGTGLAEQDYRWAIEQGNVTTFVASDYQTESDLTTRQLYSDPVPTATYSTRGVEASVSSYPRLGRVWEICANENDGYPVLVWEQRTCEGPGGSSSRSQEPSAEELGLTDEEYAEFLASGLTLEQFLAARLAATGPASGVMTLGVGAVLLLLVMGLAMVSTARRWAGPGSSPTS